MCWVRGKRLESIGEMGYNMQGRFMKKYMFLFKVEYSLESIRQEVTE